nr:hypothetical protein [Frankia sp. QA3]
MFGFSKLDVMFGRTTAQAVRHPHHDLVEAGHEFYTVAGAFATRDVLDRFGGGRVVIGVTSTPFTCPPAPSETALLVHDLLVRRGLREASEISAGHAAGRAQPAVARRVGGAARGVRRARHRLAPGAAGPAASGRATDSGQPSSTSHDNLRNKPETAGKRIRSVGSDQVP